MRTPEGRIITVRVAMLGPLAVRAEDGSPVEVTGARLRALLVLLALDPGHVVTTDRLVDGVWGDEPPAEAVNALQALVSRLRRTGLTVESRPTGYRLALDPDDVDVHRFERLATHGRATLAADPATAGTVLREALGLWRGPALADAAGAPFAQAPVARLTELRLAATGDRIEAELGNGADPVPELESLVAEHPLRERFAGLLMRALAGAGRTADALAVFARTRAALAEELGADPSAELSALHVELLRADPPARARTNLRGGRNSFVGRDADLIRVTGMVGESRLVTLTGPGGSGKTRLATEVGRALVDRQPDGVWLVELAPVGDGADVPQAVLTALGLRAQLLVTGARSRGEPVEAPIDRLAGALSHRAPLLVLDNCEHLVADAAALADRLLGDCPRVRILATSREPLGITGETLWPVDPLALPPTDADPRDALTFPAVRLLADRARAVRPDFVVDETTAPAVIHVCRALDGMPLAIELAAARLRTMSLDQVATRLDDRFRLLTGGIRTALPRHQTLRAVVDWSWDLLDDDERVLLRRLAIFSGGATLEAVEQVCADTDRDRVLDLLTALVDKSLVLLDGDRYRLLETIKAYGRERLAAAGEADRVRDAFVDWFGRLAATAEPHLRRAEQLYWLDVLRADHDNLHAAVRAAVAAGDAVAATRLVANVGWYWWLHGQKIEGAELAGDVISMPGQAPVADRVLALSMAAMLTMDSAYDQLDALALFNEAVRLVAAEGLRDHPLFRLIPALHEVMAAYGTHSVSARMYVADALYDDEDPWVRGAARVMRAHASLNAGQLHEEAEADFRVSLAAFRETGERWGMSFALCSLADVVAWRGDFETALGYYEEAVRLFAELVTNEDLVRYRLKIAGLHLNLGRPDRALAWLALAEQDAERSGLVESFAAVAHARGDFARLTGDHAEADRRLTYAADLVRKEFRSGGRTVAPQFCAFIEASRGFLAAATGDLPEAVARHTEALDLAMASNDAPVIAQMLIGLADVSLHQDDPYQAAVLLGASESIRGVRDLSVPDHTRVETATKKALPPTTFREAYAKGRTTTLPTLHLTTQPPPT